jgi:hypothetical protein
MILKEYRKKMYKAFGSIFCSLLKCVFFRRDIIYLGFRKK